MPTFLKLLGPDWTKIDENVMGEFGWKEILKQFLDAETAAPLAAAWDGDCYVLYEQKQSKKLILVARLQLDSEDQTGRFYEAYSEALEKKYSGHKNVVSLPNFLSFDSPDGGVFLRCVAAQCVSAEGTTRDVFDGIDELIGWPAAPEPPKVAPAVP